MKNKLFNIIGFQGCWWACVLGVTNEIQHLGPVLMTIFLIIHFLFFTINKNEIYFILILGFIGLLIDSIFLNCSIVNYEYPISTSIAPLWILYMWLGFAATVNHSMYWLKDRYITMSIFGLIFGPLSYLAGLKLVELDSAGRILVPKDLFEFAQLNKSIVLSSSVNMIEIWDKDLYETSVSNTLKDFAKLAEEVMGNQTTGSDEVS